METRPSSPIRHAAPVRCGRVAPGRGEAAEGSNHQKRRDKVTVRSLYAVEGCALVEMGVRRQRLFLAVVPLWVEHDGLLQPAELAACASFDQIAA